MKVALAPRYRTWMFVLFPSTLGLGSAALWLHSLNWPLELDEAGLTLRNHRQVSWAAIRKIGVSRSYRDGHVCQIRIHYGDGVSKIPVHALQDGQTVVRAILTMFARTDRARARQEGRRVPNSPQRDKTDSRICGAAHSFGTFAGETSQSTEDP